MALTDDLISQFVKITNDKKDVKEESTVYGTIKIRDGRTFVQLDGANDEETLTPVTEAATALDGERVTVMIKNHTAIVTGNLSSPSARSGDVDSVNATIHDFQTVLSTKVSTEDLEAERARIADLEADNVVIKGILQAGDIDADKITSDIVEVKESLTAAQASIENLKTTKLDAEIANAKYATIENLEATNADIHNLEVTYGDFKVLTTEKLEAADASIKNLQTDKLDANTASITYAKIADLDATNVDIDNLQSGVAEIDTLIFGSATGDTIQTSFANSVIAQLGDAQIKSAMIENLTADKIAAGDIITNNVRVRSEDGSLIISDETMQISDSSRVRVQIGKDTSGDYSINIWDAEGNLMFSKGGITDNAIKEAIIRNDMVSDTANIAAHKLDIDSLFEEINGSTKTIRSSRVHLDDKAQTLDVAFKEMETEVADLGETVTSQGTQLSVVQGKIDSKVWQQDINTAITGVDTDVNTLNTQYSELSQEIDSISATVANHTSQISKKADASVVTEVNDRISQVETDISGFRTTVSSTYATKTELGSTDAKADAATQEAHRAQQLVADLEIGGRNLFRGYDETEIRLNDYKGVGGFTQFINCLTFNPCETVGEQYTISLWAKSPNGPTSLNIYNRNQEPRHFFFESTTLTPALGTEWEYFTLTITNRDIGETYSDVSCNRIEIYAPNQLGVLVKKIKVEKGNKATDWSPAPEDVQGNIDAARLAAEEAQATANQNAQNMATIVTNFNADVENLQTQIDGSITTWFYEVPPAADNQPAINWTTTDLKNIHLGDLYYDTITGYCYRWQVLNNTYSWQRITDTDVTKALSDAKTAQDTADQKRRVFYAQPAPPYDLGDLWVQGSGGDILRCKTAKMSGQSYSSSDWIAASKYTDDTVANTANNNAIAAQNAASKAQSDIDNLSIGGRNLILNSAAILLNGSDDGNSSSSVRENDYVAITPKGNGNIYNNGGVKTSVPRKKGVEYTLSFEILTPTKIGFYWHPSEHYTKTNSIQSSDSWQKYVFTYTQTGNDASNGMLFGFNGLVAGEKYCYRNLKLEVGNRATDWTPAPEDLESEVTVLTERVSNAESKISQAESSIALTVTKTEVSKTYATKTELTNAQNDTAATYATKTELSTAQSELSSTIELREDSILSSVSNTYATKTALNTTNSNVTAAKNAADAAQADIDNLEIGGRNLFSGYDDSEIQLNDYQGVGGFTQFYNCLTFNPCETVGETYTISFWAKSPNGPTPITIYNQNGQPRHFYFGRASFPNQLTDEWQYFTHTVTNVDRGETYDDAVCNRIEIYASGQLGVLVKKIKVERGTRATDWTPAPEDMATAAEVATAQKNIEAADERISTTESLIQQLSDSITMLVTDSNGESLMVQTETGWTFSTAQIQDTINSTSENLNNLTHELGDIDTTVNSLRQAVIDLGVLNDYVKIGTYENEPCIELGESDSDFKLMITNTRIMFMEGSSVPAYINNQSLNIKKAVIEDELQQGEFVWQVRSNGNLGLIWKGANS